MRWPEEAHRLQQQRNECRNRYAALVGKIRALADEWDGYGHGRYNVHLEERLSCPACDLLADLRGLLEAVQ
jgi:hypothetical protein